jgi:agmatinase
MPLLDAPLPRMAGRLSFMRAACGTLDDVKPGGMAIVGLPVEDLESKHSGQSLAPRGLRETSVYFGWHANPQFQHPIDVEDRREISAAGIFERMLDLGDLRATSVETALPALQSLLWERKATTIYLGGNPGIVDALLEPFARSRVVRLGGMGNANDLALAPLSGNGVHSDPDRPPETVRAMLHSFLDGSQQPVAVFDLSVFATSISGLCDNPRIGGCHLPEVALWLSALGEAKVTTIFLTGLNPTLSGMGIIKTGQRLMVTALLSFVYASFGVAHSAPAPAIRQKVHAA